MVFIVNIIEAGKVYVHWNFMNFVEPIRDLKKIAQAKDQLRGQRRYRDLLLFVVGINTALRISDLLELQIENFQDDHQRIKRRFLDQRAEAGQNVKRMIKHRIEKLCSLAQYPISWLIPTRAITFSTAWFILSR